MSPLATGQEAARHASPALSVIVPVCNEAKHITECLRSILKDEPAGGMEVIVVDGDSADGTTAIVQALGEQEPRIRLLRNPCRFVPHAMNIGISASRAPYIGRIDGHCRVVSGYFDGCLRRLRDRSLDCVGGALVNRGTTPVGRAIAAATSSPVGVGSARFRTGRGGESLVDTLAFGIYRREVFARIGLFDETFVRNQDDEFNFRLVRRGGKILLAPSLKIIYFVRDSLLQLGRQYYQYGYWKWRVFRKHGRVASLRQVTPSLFVLLVICAATSALFSNLGRIALVGVLALYLLSVGGEAARLTFCQRAPFFRTALALGTLHFCYGSGLLKAIVDGLIWGDHSDTKRAPTALSR
jgi:glycosyltransferase involved in cell wall biosynthesis